MLTLHFWRELCPPPLASAMKSVHVPFGSRPLKELRNAVRADVFSTASGSASLASGAYTPVSIPATGMLSFPKRVLR